MDDKSKLTAAVLCKAPNPVIVQPQVLTVGQSKQQSGLFFLGSSDGVFTPSQQMHCLVSN